MSSNVTELVVTFGSALAPPKFHRVVTKDAHAADINRGNASPVFLWYKNGGGAPVVELEVLYGEDAVVPEGFHKIRKDLTKGLDSKVYLAYRRRVEGDTLAPITDLRIVYKEDEELEEGFERLGQSLSGKDVWLHFKRRAEGDVEPEGKPAWSAEMLRVGDYFDCKDAIGRWSVAKVVDMTDTHVTVNYKGWSDRYNDTFPKTSAKLAELGAHTSGQDGRVYKAQGQAFTLELAALDTMANRIDDWINGTFPEEAKENFFKVDLPMIVETCLSSRVAVEIRARVNTFTQEVHRFVVHYLKMPEPMHKTISQHFQRLFLNDESCNFFFMNYGGTACNAPEAPEINGAVARLPEGGASRFFVENMNKFGEHGGYDCIVARLSKTGDDLIPLDEAAIFTKCLWRCRFCYAETWATEVFPKFQQALLQRVALVTDEELKDLDRNVVADTMRYLDGLTKVLTTNYGAEIIGTDTDEKLEMTQLAIARRMLMCPYFNQRLKGLTDIKEFVERVMDKESRRSAAHGRAAHRVTYRGGYPYQQSVPKPTKWLDTPRMAAWLADTQVLDYCLGAEVDGKTLDNLHVEIVKRLAEIAEFMADQGQITPAHLELLWNLAVRRPDLRRAGYAILAKLSGSLSVPLLDTLFGHVASLPAAEYDDVSIELIKAFTGNAFEVVAAAAAAATAGEDGDGDATPPAAEEPKWYGLTLLWNIIDGTTAVEDDVGAEARAAFTELLKAKQAGSHLQHYLCKCMENLGEGRSVPQSLSIAKELLEALPHYATTGEPFDCQEAAIDTLQERYSTTAKLIGSLAAYKAAATEAAGKMDMPVPATGATGGEDTVLVGALEHSEEVQTRLEFLSYAVAHGSTTTLSFDDLAALWGECAQRNATPDEREVFSAWLLAAKFAQDAATAGAAFEDDVAVRVFEELMCDPKAGRLASMGPAAYRAFEALFRFVNRRDGRLVAAGGGAGFSVTDTALQGLATLWDVALSSSSREVARTATKFLIDLHVQVAATIPGGRRDVWGSFVASCMDRVAASLPDVAASPAAARVIEVAMHLLRDFLDEVESAGRKKAAANDTVTIYVRPQPHATHNQTLTCKVSLAATTLAELREDVARSLKLPANQVRLETLTSVQLHADQSAKTLAALGIRTGLYGTKLEAPAPDTVGHEEPRPPPLEPDRRYPREMLSNSRAYFDLLFQLLALPHESIVNDAWSLLQSLPTNADIEASIAAVGEGEETPLEWGALLDGGAPLKLLYSLEIVDKLVAPSPDKSDAERGSQDRWCAAFLARGGLDHLVSVVAGCDVGAWMGATLPKTCLALLLKLVNLFAVTAKGGAGGTAPALAPRLLAICAAAAAAAEGFVESRDAGADDFEIKNEGAARTSSTQAGAGGAGTGAADEDPGLDDDPLFGSMWDDDPPAAAAPAPSPEAARKAPATREAQVIRHALNLFVVVTLQAGTDVAAVFAAAGADAAALFSALLASPDPSVRAELERGFLQLVYKFYAAREAGGSAPEGVVAPGAGAGAELVVLPTPLSAAVATGPLHHFAAALVAALPRVYDAPDACSNFFGLLATVVRLSGEGSPVNAADFVATVSAMVASHPVVEVSAEEEDAILRGLYTVLGAVLARHPELKATAGDPEGGNLIDEVFTEGLFKIPTADSPRDAPPPKCKHSSTRHAAFLLLTELVKGCPSNHTAVCGLVAPHHRASPTPKPATASSHYKYRLAALPKSSVGYVGLKNLGCICYMNASMQNFFMVPEFRRGVLTFEDEEEDKAESLMFQLQKQFAYLQESEKQAYNPKGLCHAFKDWEGQPTDVLVQKDASEFLTMLFQHMEGQLQGTPQESLLRDVFGGTSVQELIADGHYSERDEPFSFISVEVKNRKDLHSGLLDFISGETVDYKWENEDGTKTELATRKRVSIKTLPRHLIIHLKRFEFDYDTLQHAKLNDRFEFPRELDMFPYTAEGRPDQVDPKLKGKGKKEEAGGEADDPATPAGVEEGKEAPEGEAPPAPVHPPEYYKYNLAGMVIHMGTAQAGHYYSFIRERLPNHRLGRWMLFNDSQVSAWNDGNLEREAFGGEETYTVGGYTSYWGTTTPGYTTTRVLSRNAFLCFYDRVPPVEVDADAEAPEPTDRAVAHQGAVRATALAASMLAKHRARKAQFATRGVVPPAIFQMIWEENMEFWRTRNIFDKEYFDFIYQLVNVAAGPEGPEAVAVPYPSGGVATEAEALALGGPSLQTAKLATSFIIHTLSTSAHKAAMPQWIKRLQALYSSNMVACVHLLQTLMADQAPLRRFLLESDEEGTRKALAGLVSFVLKCVSSYERPHPDPAECGPAVPTVAPALSSQGSGGSAAGGATESKAGDGGGLPPSEVRFPAPAGRVVVTFVETLLSMLPGANLHWRRFVQYFQVLADFAAVGPDERAFLLKRGVVGQVIDFLLEDDSPHPELNDVIEVPRSELRRANSNSSVGGGGGRPIGPTLPGGAVDDTTVDELGDLRVHGHAVGTSTVKTRGRKAMGDYYASPNFTTLFALLKTLLVSSAPPSGVASPEQDDPGLPLSDLDLEMVTCKPFLTRLFSEMTPSRVAAFKPLIRHLAWGSEDVTAAMTDCLAGRIQEEDYDTLKKYFRGAAVLMKVDDDLQEARVETCMTAIVEAMASQQLFFKATELSIDLLVKLGKHNPRVRAWMAANAEAWAWVGDWLTKNPTAPYMYSQPGTMRLVKPTTVTQSYGGGYADPARNTKVLQQNVTRLLGGEELIYEGYDSEDDPDILLGRRVALFWKSNKWYFGKVNDFSAETGKHHIAYDDGDEKWYFMSTRVFHVVLDDAPATTYNTAPTEDIIVRQLSRGGHQATSAGSQAGIEGEADAAPEDDAPEAMEDDE